MKRFTLLFFFSLVTCEHANAQLVCTTPCGNPADWTGPVMLTVPMDDPCGGPGTVNVTICYCYPNPSGPITPKQQIIINNFSIQPASPCPVDVTWTRELKRKLLEYHLAATDFCDGKDDCSEWCQQNPQCICPDAQPSWELKSASCMKPDYASFPGEVVWNKCGAGICGSIFEICCYNGTASARWLASDGIEGDCDGTSGCYLVCGQDETDPNIGCHLADGTPVMCCCGGGCPEPNTGKCPEDIQDCPGPAGPNTLFRCCDGNCPDPITTDCL